MKFFKNANATIYLEKFLNDKQKLNQNLLFWGEESVGKMTTAKIFSETLLCKNYKKWERCNQCSSCQMMNQGYHPDLMIIEPELDKENNSKNIIEIEQVRQGLNFLIYHSQISDTRILIINKAELMSKDSQNTLLKTLEESRKNSLIILVTKFPQKLLTTIRSRVLPIRFKRANQKSLLNFLQKEHSLPLKEAQEITKRADGKIGKAIKLMDKEYFKELEQKRKDLVKILNQGFSRRVVYFQELTKDNNKLNSTLEEWLRMLQPSQESQELHLSTSQKIKLTKEILKAIYLINNVNINKQLLMENIFMRV